MALVVGTNSYVDEAYITTYATDRGITLTGDASVLGVQAMDYLEAQNFKGSKTDSAQPLQWPRTGVYIDGVLVDSAVVPSEVEVAQAVIAVSISQGYNPNATYGPAVKREKVDVIEIEYQDNAGATDYSPAITNALRPIVDGSAGGAFLEVCSAR